MFETITRNIEAVPKNSIKATAYFSSCSVKQKETSRFNFLMISAGVLFLLFLHAPSYGGSLSDHEKTALYNEATEFFHQATELSESDTSGARDLYQKALLRFQRLVDEGDVSNGKLFYNIGNIHFLLDDIGRAILNYRRAEQYIPNDPNLVKNLAYARSMRPDKLDIKEGEKVLHTLFFFHYDLRTQTRLILFCLAYVSFWLVAGTRIFSRQPFTSWGLGVTLLLVLLFGTSLIVESRKSTMKKEGVILVQEVVARQGDAESYQPSFEAPLHGGTEFALRETRGEWWHIELPDGRSSWIPAKSGELVGKN
ncbi:MAG: tetratricopeptide repeat protein [Deltaproteobacteria bacterium]|jgi:tetratricopeptide (TPR) repeat protein|nr:tetratricopeptide repeat protein [Deltaproteobacteria bacterium]